MQQQVYFLELETNLLKKAAGTRGVSPGEFPPDSPLDTVIIALKEKYDRMEADYKNKITALKEKIVELENQQDEARDSDGEDKEVHRGLSFATTKRNANAEEIMEEKCKKMQEELESFKLQIEVMTTTSVREKKVAMDAAEKRLALQRDTVVKANQAVQRLEFEVKARDCKIEELQHLVALAEAERAQTSALYLELKDGLRRDALANDALRDQNSQLAEQNAMLKKEVEESKIAVKQIMLEKDAAKELLERLKANEKVYASQVAETTALGEKWVTSLKEADALRSTVAELENQMEDAQAVVQVLRKDAEELETKLKRKEEELAMFKARVPLLEEDVEDKAGQVSALRLDVEDLSLQVEEEKAENARLATEVQQVDARRMEVEAEWNARKSELGKDREKVAGLEGQIEQLNKDKQELKVKIRRSKRSLSLYKSMDKLNVKEFVSLSENSHKNVAQMQELMANVKKYNEKYKSDDEEESEGEGQSAANAAAQD